MCLSGFGQKPDGRAKKPLQDIKIKKSFMKEGKEAVVGGKRR